MLNPVFSLVKLVLLDSVVTPCWCYPVGELVSTDWYGSSGGGWSQYPHTTTMLGPDQSRTLTTELTHQAQLTPTTPTSTTTSTTPTTPMTNNRGSESVQTISQIRMMM